MTHACRSRVLSICSLATLAFAAGLTGLSSRAHAADAVVAPASVEEKEVHDIVVTATVSQATIVAPVRSNLATVQPEAVITRKFMEETAPRVGDFSTVAAFAPGMIATPQANGPGLSDGGKVQLRGFADGSYTITYDGVAWGDTNGPSHHGTAFFPNSTIGGIIIDRGPGKAEDMGPANFGGSVNLKSLPFEDKLGATQTYTNGSFGTNQFVTTVQSGDVGGAHFLANFQELSSNGYLTNNFTWGNSQMFKGAVPITGAGLTLTALYTHTTYLYNKSDIGDADVYQLNLYGKNFSLSNDPKQENYYKYNWARKETNFEYAKLAGEIAPNLGIDNTVYSYGYDNDTESGANNLAAAPDTNSLATPFTSYSWTATPGASYPAAGKALTAKNGATILTDATGTQIVPGYLKKNEYVVTGDIAKAYYDTPVGRLTGGVWVERADTYRYIVDYNLINMQPDYREKAATTAGISGVYTNVPLNDQYIEFSGWKQYQPFVQFEWKPISSLAITPGVKYVDWTLNVTAPVEKIASGAQPLDISKTWTKTLPFLTANYRITNYWSAYAQYAQGILFPNIGNLYVSSGAQTAIVPQLSTNYQLGSVYNRGNLSLDGDVYYIQFQHKIQSFTDPVSGQAYDTNSGGATYKGLEVQANYVLPYGLSVFGNYAYISAIGTNDPTNPLYNGHQLTGVPLYTAAAGARYERRNIFHAEDGFIVSLISKFVGSQDTINASCPATLVNGVCPTPAANINAFTNGVNGVMPAYNEFDLSLSYHILNYAIEGQILNLLNTRSLVSIKGKNLLANGHYDLTDSTFGGAATANTNAPEYQVPTNFQITLKAKF